MNLANIAEALGSGRLRSNALVREALERIEAPEGEGRLAFIKVHRDAALSCAKEMDSLRSSGSPPSPFAGIPISVKDLFDLAGETTTAGSVVLADAPPATRDAPAIARLRRAGFVVVGRTNMTEFAYSGLGLNPHYGTPAAPYERAIRRIPGGSSSGAAVSVTDGMATAAIGTDTGGSCRIPAALCGLTGYKPTAASVPLDGAFPLSPTLDSIGSLAKSVACCRTLHEFMSGTELPKSAIGLAGLRVAVPQTVALDGLDAHVAATFSRALTLLSQAGAQVEEHPFSRLSEVAQMNSKGGFAAAESYAHHRQLLKTKGEGYDPRVRSRILRGRNQDSTDYIELLRARAAFVAALREEASAFDVLALPTVPTVGPTIAECDANDDAYSRLNLLMLRNPSLINMMDGCAISLPMHREGEAPTGLMLAMPGGKDATLFDVAAAVEAVLHAKR